MFNKIQLLICLFFISSASLFAQKDSDNLEYYNKVLKTLDIDFETNASSDKWNDESAVILSQIYHLGFSRLKHKGGGYRIKGINRKKILLQDKAAIEEFSEFFYQESETIRITLIKPNGEKKEIDFTNAVTVETEVPRIFSSDFQSSRYYKIAIPDLEVGDILDYFVIFSEAMRGPTPYISTLSSSYPILKQQFILDFDKGWSHRSIMLNTDLTFEKMAVQGVDNKGKQTRNVRRYVLKDESRAPFDNERWDYYVTSESLYKLLFVPPEFQLSYFIVDNGLRSYSKKVLDSGISDKQVEAYVKEIKKELIKEKIPTSNTALLCQRAYYHIREKFLNSYAATPDFGRVNSRDLERLDNGLQEVQMNGAYFTIIYSVLLDKFDIPTHAIACPPRYIGTVNQLISPNEVVYTAYVPKIDLYLEAPNNFHNHTDSHSTINDAQGVAYQLGKGQYGRRKAFNYVERITFPSSDYLKNTSEVNLDIKLDIDTKIVEFQNQSIFDGNFKDRYSMRFLRFDINFMAKDYKKLFNQELNNGATRSQVYKTIQKANATKEEYEKEAKENQNEMVKGWFDNDHSVKDFNSFEIVHTGRTPDHLKLEVKANYTSESFLTKAGNNYLFDLGKLIGSQVELEEEEIKERKKDIELSYARQLINNITVTLPDGYNAEGLDKIKYNVDHPTCAFTVTAAQEGNLLKVKTVKAYKKSTLVKEDWPQLVEMLEASYNFSQAKIVLKK